MLPKVFLWCHSALPYLALTTPPCYYHPSFDLSFYSPTTNVMILQLLYAVISNGKTKKVPKHLNRKRWTQWLERISPTSVPILHWTMNTDSGPWLTLAWPTSYGILRTPRLTTVLFRDIKSNTEVSKPVLFSRIQLKTINELQLDSQINKLGLPIMTFLYSFHSILNLNLTCSVPSTTPD